MSRDSHASFAQAVFAARRQCTDRFVRAILEQLAGKTPRRVLDIGCGTGDQLFSLADRLKADQLVGVDISAPNIETAVRTASARADKGRFNFSLADYPEWRTSDQFDLIISYSTLHLIPINTEALFSKLSSDLKPGGRVIFTIPYDCLYNRWLSLVRRLFKALRSPMMDATILWFGKILNKGTLDENHLRERVLYMYQLPKRYDGPALRELLKTHCGLEVIAEHPEAHASIAQLKHRLIVIRKPGPAG